MNNVNHDDMEILFGEGRHLLLIFRSAKAMTKGKSARSINSGRSFLSCLFLQAFLRNPE